MARSNRRLWRATAAVLALGLVASACGSDDDGGDDASGDDSNATEYSIAYVGPKTGEAKNLGINILNGAKLAVDQFNESQDEIKINLEEFDTQGDEKQAQSQFESYNADSKIIGIVGPAFSGETEAALPLLQNAGLPMISASATRVSLADIVGSDKAAKTPEGYSVFHRLLPDDNKQAGGIAKFLDAQQAGKSIFFVNDLQAYSTGLVEELQTASAKSGHANKGRYQFESPDETNMSNAVTAIGSAKPDIVFFGGYYALAGRLKKALGDDDATKDILFVSGDGSLDTGFIDGAGANAEGSAIACPCNLATEAAAGKLGQFAKDYKAAFGQDAGTYSSEAFDAANLFIEGIKAGNTTRAKLLAYLETLTSYEGISKTITFAENGNATTDDVFVFDVKDGKFVPLADTTS